VGIPIGPAGEPGTLPARHHERGIRAGTLTRVAHRRDPL